MVENDALHHKKNLPSSSVSSTKISSSLLR